MRGKALRVDEELDKLLKSIKRDRLIRGIDIIPTSERRLGKVVARAVQREASLYDEIVNSNIEDDTKFIRRRRKSR